MVKHVVGYILFSDLNADIIANTNSSSKCITPISLEKMLSGWKEYILSYFFKLKSPVVAAQNYNKDLEKETEGLFVYGLNNNCD